MTINIQARHIKATPPVFFSLNGLFTTRDATLANPFPNGVGSREGAEYGKLAIWGLDNSSDLNVGTARSAEIYQWNLGIQRALPASVVVSINYSANRSTHLPWGGTNNRNFISSSVRQQYGSSAALNQPVDNPFQSMFSGPSAMFNDPQSRYGGSQLPTINLLRPYPQFDGSTAPGYTPRFSQFGIRYTF